MGMAIPAAGVTPFVSNGTPAWLQEARATVSGGPVQSIKAFYEQEDVDAFARLAWLNDCLPSLYEAAEGATVRMSYEEWAAQKQAEGIAANDVAFAALEFDLQQALSLAARAPAQGVDVLDSLAARYAVTRSRIEEVYSGSAREEALERLEGIFGSAMQAMVDDMAAVYEKELKKYGLGGEAGVIRDSLWAVYTEARDGYLEYAAANPDYMGVRDTAKEWHMSLDGFASNMLQKAAGAGGAAANAAAETAKASGEAGGYTRAELKALAVYLDEMANFNASNALVNEEELGFRLGDLAARLSYANAALGVGGAFEGLANRLMEGFVEHMLQRADSRVDAIREMDTYTVVDHSREAYIVRENVMQVYNAMLATLEKGGSLAEVWRTGYETGWASYQKSTQNPLLASTVRYGSGYGSARFFADFYTQTYTGPRTLVPPASAVTPVFGTGQETLTYEWAVLLATLGLGGDPLEAGLAAFA